MGNGGTLLRITGEHERLIATGTRENLRCAAVSSHGTAVVVGNRGTVLRVEGDTVNAIRAVTAANLRRVASAPRGEGYLVVGNEGACLRLAGDAMEKVEGAEANLRSVAWHPSGRYSVVTANCFRPSMGGLVPSPAAYLLEGEGSSLQAIQPVSESRADLIASSWRPDGSICTLVGVDSVWQTAVIAEYDPAGRGVSVPTSAVAGLHSAATCVSWEPGGRYALLGTSPASAGGVGGGVSRTGDRDEVSLLLGLRGHSVCSIDWNDEGIAVIVASKVPAFAV